MGDLGCAVGTGLEGGRDLEQEADSIKGLAIDEWGGLVGVCFGGWSVCTPGLPGQQRQRIAPPRGEPAGLLRGEVVAGECGVGVFGKQCAKPIVVGDPGQQPADVWWRHASSLVLREVNASGAPRVVA